MLLQRPDRKMSRGRLLRLVLTLMGPSRMMTMKRLEGETYIHVAIHDRLLKPTWTAFKWHNLGLSNLLGVR